MRGHRQPLVRVGFVALVLVVLCLGSLSPLGARPVLAASGPPLSLLQGRFIVREGTRIVDQPGYFRISGDRIVFFSTQHNTRYVVLENLNLERIAGVMADQSDRRRWKVNGTLSEYRGDNYLLVEKVVLESWGDTVRHSP